MVKAKAPKARAETKPVTPSESSMGMVKYVKSPPQEALAQTLADTIRVFPGAESRKMFGYPAAFIEGRNFAGLYADYMVLRLSTGDLAAFLKLDGARPFEPMPGRSMGGYAVVPPAIVASSTELTAWLGKAYEHTKSLPARKPKKKKV